MLPVSHSNFFNLIIFEMIKIYFYNIEKKGLLAIAGDSNPVSLLWKLPFILTEDNRIGFTQTLT